MGEVEPVFKEMFSAAAVLLTAVAVPASARSGPPVEMRGELICHPERGRCSELTTNSGFYESLAISLEARRRALKLILGCRFAGA
jgi:hypothetical protein